MADDGLSRLTDDEKTALTALLKRTIADYRYPLSPRITTLKGILAKLQPPKPAPPPLNGQRWNQRAAICAAAPNSLGRSGCPLD
jgi:hypothetical protein